MKSDCTGHELVHIFLFILIVGGSSDIPKLIYSPFSISYMPDHTGRVIILIYCQLSMFLNGISEHRSDNTGSIVMATSSLLYR
jgi:hypothetical protein